MKNKTIKITLLALLLLPFCGLSVAKAAGAEAGEKVYVSREQIVAGNLYAVGESITIDGTVGGDLIAAASTITVNGRIEGDIIAAAQDITVNGEVGGNIRIAGDTLTINGSVARNVNAFGANIYIGQDAAIGWDLYLAGSNIEIRGNINGGLEGAAGQALITGKIGKDVNLKLSGRTENLTIESGAIINGQLTYTAEAAAKISPAAAISGPTEHKLPPLKDNNLCWAWLWGRLFSIFAALVVGLVLIFPGRKITSKILDKLASEPKKMFLPGIIILLVLPPAAIIIACTLIGLPLALIIGAWWLVATYVAKIMAAILVGRLLINKIYKKNGDKLVWPLVAGVVICWLIFAVPFAGWLLSLVAVCFGLGGIWTYASHKFRSL